MTELDYRPTPFWFWNHRLEKEEIELQVKLMADAGCGGFFIHPRAGLKTPYLSEACFEAVGWAGYAAEKYGVKAWLYDEDPFPSGAAGGSIFFEHPEFAARSIRFYELEPDTSGLVEGDVGKGIILEAWGIRCDDDGKQLEQCDLSTYVGVVRPDFFMTAWDNSYYAQISGKERFPHYRGECFYPRNRFSCQLQGKGWKVYVVTAEIMAGTEKYGAMPDNLNHECVSFFINKTHEEYRKRFGDKFGTVIPGIFTDEPAMGGSPPWTGELESCFLAEHGYSLRGNYAYLFTDGDNEMTAKVRLDYWNTVDALFARNYFGQISSWCHKNNLLLVGHCIGEESPTSSGGGTSLADMQKYFDIPGFDHITNNIPNGDFQSLNFGGKLIASAAARAGIPRIMSECFACNPFNFGMDGMKKIASWLFSLGINYLVPHGFFYSYDGFRKYEAGKSFFFQDPEFARFKDFSTWAAGIGELLGQSSLLAHLCLIVPMEQIRSLLPAHPEQARILEEKVFATVKQLMEHQIQFDLIDERTLQQGRVSSGHIYCGKQTYSEVLMAVDDSQLSAWCGDYSIRHHMLPRDLEHIAALCGLAELDTDATARARIYAHLRKDKHGLIACLFNNSCEQTTFSFRWKNSDQLFIYDQESGRWHAANAGESLRLDAFSSLILSEKLPTGSKLESSHYPLTETACKKKSFTYETAPQWDYLPPVDGFLCHIADWKITAGACDYGRRRFCMLRDLAGTELPHMNTQRPRPIFDQAALTASIYPMTMNCTAVFELTPLSASESLWLVWESETFAGNCRIFINGIPLSEGQRKRIYDPWNITASLKGYCHSGQNRIDVQWDTAGEFDGMRGALYVFSSKTP
ncbi:MAG: hypothetical protein JXR78_00970 [Victivallales bacterium]|nr:hypothetical protein [Victivallales bacterium]